MPEWYVRFRSATSPNPVVAEYLLQQPECEVRNSEAGGFSGELALGQKRRQSPNFGITRDQFAPYRTWWELWRHSSGSGVCVSDGMLTSVNLNRDRDSALIAGKDWKHYLDRRVYPFYPESYKTFDDAKPEEYWDKWPKKWVEPDGSEVPVSRIVRDLLLGMRTGIPIDFRSPSSYLSKPRALGVPPFTWTLNVDTGPVARYKIYPGDQTTILAHLNTLAEMNDGFEWDIEPLSFNYRIWQPQKYQTDNPIYHFAPSALESGGMVTDFDWTNEGPDGTYLFGYGAAKHKMGAIWSYEPSLEQFGRYDLVYDYGTVADYNVILRKLKDQNDLWPQKRLSMTILNPEYLPLNFYTGGRPRSVLANTVRVTKNFPPYHQVDAFFQVNAIKWNVDESSNELVELELMMIYEPETGLSKGLP